MWSDISTTYGHHLRDGCHDDGGRYGFDLTIATPGREPEGFVVGPVCAGCLVTTAQLVEAWTAAYVHLDAQAECAAWSDLAASAHRGAGAR